MKVIELYTHKVNMGKQIQCTQAGLTRNRRMPGKREFEPHDRPKLLP